MVHALWRTIWRFLKKLKIELPYDPAIPLLGMYLEKTVTHPHVHSSTIQIAKIWKKPKYSSTDEWEKRRGVSLSEKQNRIMPPAMWETQIQFLGREDPLEKNMTTYSSILAWRILRNR